MITNMYVETRTLKISCYDAYPQKGVRGTHHDTLLLATLGKIPKYIVGNAMIKRCFIYSSGDIRRSLTIVA